MFNVGIGKNQYGQTYNFRSGTYSRPHVKPKPVSRQNKKLKQQHNWKKGSSSPREASVPGGTVISLSVILSVCE
jgi:hypothetical protein